MTDDDYKAVEAGMTTSSKFEHDAASAIERLPVPAPDDIAKDLNDLEVWRDYVNKRLGDTRKDRSLLIANNTREEAMLGDFQKAVDDAIFDSSEAHQKQMMKLLSMPDKGNAFANIIYELLNAPCKEL